MSRACRVFEQAMAAAALSGLAGCAGAPAAETARIDHGLISAIERDLAAESARSSLLSSLDASRDWFSQPESRGSYPRLGVTHERARASVDRLIEVIGNRSHSASEVARQIAQEFELIDGSGGREVLFTAYFAPEFDGSWEETVEYRFPLYETPLVPRGNTRREIEERGALRGWELIWLRDPFDAYMAHVNGSARIRLPDGMRINLGHAATNEMRYTSIGRLLIEEGVIDEADMSMQTLRAYFDDHPAELTHYIWRNDRFVFFEVLPEGAWPRASIGVPLTPKRSLATDHAVLPAGCAAIAEFNAEGRPAFIVVNHDTGGAIRGPARADWFIGVGDEAGEEAGGLIEHGSLQFLILKADVPSERRRGE